ncbi:MAG: LysR family transcriptional regulator [Lachnospiraceae bacterium]|nr:LysR family transcriptional regulator [Lachnospiraceae bacterium]
MKTIYLNEFLTLAEQLNFSTAAKKLGITLPTLSRHIKQMEEELGVPLFTRTTQKIELTPYGLAYISHANVILESERAFSKKAEQISRDTASRLAVGVCGFPHYYGIISLLADFKKHCPEAVIDVSMEPFDNTTAELQSGRLDAAFIHDAGDLEDQYIMVPFHEDYLSVTLPASHRLASAPCVHLADLKDETFFLRHKEGSSMNQLEREALCSAGLSPRLSSDRGTRDDSAINRGKRISLVKLGLANKLRSNPNVAIVPVEPRIHVDLYLVYPKKKKLPAVVKEFVRYTAENRFM